MAEAQPQEPTKVQVTTATIVRRDAQGPAWLNSLFGCFSNCGICMQTYCCGLCTITNMVTKIDTDLATCECSQCLIMCCTCCHNCWAANGVRRTIIERYGIEGEGLCKTCLIDKCCCYCALCQTQREMADRGQGVGGCCGPASAPEAPPVMAIPEVGDLPGGGNGKRPIPVPGEFSTGLCGCSCMECLDVYCCTCCVLGHLATRLQPENAMNDVTGNDFCVCCCGCADGCNMCYMMRRQTVERFQIKESACKTFCCVSYCALCLLMQTRREHGVRSGVWPGGFCSKSLPWE